MALLKFGSSSVSVHIEKLKRGQMNGMQRHNERREDEAGATVKHSNENINRDRTHENISLTPTDGSWTKRFDKIIEEKYTGKRGVRSDAVTAISLTCQFEGTVTEDEAEQVRLLTEFNDWLKERYPNVISSEIHLDETKPGLHFVLVPLTEDGRLSAKEIFSKTNLKKLQDDSLEFFQGVGHKHGFHRLTEEERLERGGSGRSLEQFKAYEDLKQRYESDYESALAELEMVRSEEEKEAKALSEALRSSQSDLERLKGEYTRKHSEATREALRASERHSEADVRENALKRREDALRASEGALRETKTNLLEWKDKYADAVKKQAKTWVNGQKQKLDEREKSLDVRESELSRRASELEAEQLEHEKAMMEMAELQREIMIEKQSAEELKSKADEWWNTIRTYQDGLRTNIKHLYEIHMSEQRDAFLSSIEGTSLDPTMDTPNMTNEDFKNLGQNWGMSK